ncbi:MAG TPA: phosphoribosylamine--glycine ligase [Terriglobales bacterium]|nr:phosphoribosylamine--glycine ligase [Terriglobales bacterium]
MKVLVIGSGGREHALVWKILQSPRVAKVYCAPGNGGIEAEPRVECIAWDGKDVESLLGFASNIAPDLTVVGPELPLTLGVVDEFQKRGLRIFGPTQRAAQLEASKAFSKEFMRRHAIPTAKYAVCPNAAELKDALQHFSGRVVVKADGLAAGKGVVIADTPAEAATVAAEMMSGATLGSAGNTVVLEEFLEGEELSLLVLSDGDRVAPLAAARDHKRIGEGDTGANTGGMGAYSTADLVEDHMVEWIMHHIAQPVIAGMKAEDAEYRGILYLGLMMTARGPEVLEFNCRFGDPETQPILMRLDSDILDAFDASIDGTVTSEVMQWSSDPTVCIVLASGGYPAAFETGKPITGIDEANAVEGVKVFHAGTRLSETQDNADLAANAAARPSARESEAIVTAGGRVLSVTARAATLDAALARAYEAASKIHFDGIYYRRDIAAKTLVK